MINPSLPVNDVQIMSSLITKESTRNLLPGLVHRHTGPRPSYGMRARALEMRKIRRPLSYFHRNDESHYAPLFTCFSSLQQGKTMFFDEIGYDWRTLRAFKLGGNVGNDDDDDDDWQPPAEADFHNSTSNIFIFNVTFGARWPLSDCDAMKIAQQAKDEISLRLLAAAMGHFSSNNNNNSNNDDSSLSHIKTIQQFLQNNHAQNVSPRHILDNIIRPRLAQIHNVEPSQMHFLFLLDDFANLQERLPQDDSTASSDDAAGSASSRKSLSMAVGELISSHSAVFINGHKHVPASRNPLDDRHAIDIELRSVGSDASRRQALPMTSEFFQLAGTLLDWDGEAKEDQIDAAAFKHWKPASPTRVPLVAYELAKSSLSLLGHCVGWLEAKASSSTPSSTSTPPFGFVSEMYNAVPVCASLLDSANAAAAREKFDAMLKVLQWKSVQFLSGPKLTQREAMFASIVADCVKAQEKRLAELPRGLDNKDQASFSGTSLEPLLWSLAVETFAPPENIFNEYLHRFKGFALCMLLGEPQRDELVCARFDVNAMAPERQTPRYNEEMVDYLVPGIVKVFQQDAICVGIRFQRQLRRQVHNEHATPIIASVDSFLEGATNVVALTRVVADKQTTNTATTITGPRLKIRWTGEGSSSSAQQQQQHEDAVVVDFDFAGNPYPCNKKDAIDLGAEFFSTTAIHRPKRVSKRPSGGYGRRTILENPLAAVVFHEKLEGSDDLVQFWIDNDESSVEFPIKPPRYLASFSKRVEGFAADIRDALSNKLLQDPNNKAKHVVHIIVSPSVVSDDNMKQLRAAITNQCSSVFGDGLHTYTLYIVNPDSVAFENLVSQPIARSMPLTELQLQRARCEPVPPPRSWSEYKAVIRDHNFYSEQAFHEWRNLCFDEDSKTRIGSLISPSSLKELCTQNYNEWRMLPFRTWLQFREFTLPKWYPDGTEVVPAFVSSLASSSALFKALDALVCMGHVIHHIDDWKWARKGHGPGTRDFWRQAYEQDEKFAVRFWCITVIGWENFRGICTTNYHPDELDQAEKMRNLVDNSTNWIVTRKYIEQKIDSIVSRRRQRE